MSKFFRLITSLWGLMFISAPIEAASVFIEVCDIQSSVSGKILVRACEGWTSQNGCNDGWAGWSTSTEGGQAMLSLALTGQSTGKQLMLRTTAGSCIAGYDEIDIVRVVND